MNTVNTMLLFEALVVILLLCGAVAIINAKRKQRDRAGVNRLIQTIGLTSDQHALQLEDQFAKAPDIDQQAVKDLIQSAKKHEKGLYQHIISLYLKRDVDLLGQLGSKIEGLTGSYLELMSQLTVQDSATKKNPGELIALQMQLDQAIAEKKRLSRELKTVSNTLENVSDEYAQMFGGTPAFDELNASKVRMLRMIEQTIQDMSPEDVSEEPFLEASAP